MSKKINGENSRSDYIDDLVERINSGKLVLEQENIQLKTELVKTKEENDSFLRIVMHDIKSPLGGLTGLIEILESNFDSFSEEKKKEIIKFINIGGHDISTLLENLSQLRPINGEIPYNPENIDLSQTGKREHESEMSIIEQQAKKKGVYFISTIKENTLAYVDPKFINVVFKNLINNAIKFTNEGGTITLSANASVDDNFITVSVKDEGIGMTQDQVSRLFQNKMVKPTKGTDSENGTGFGLQICEKFVKKMGGKIWVESKVGEGSTFSFTLPKTAPVADTKNQVAEVLR